MSFEDRVLKSAAAILGRKGGKAKSPAKTAAARANARKPRPNRKKKIPLT